MCRHHVTIVSTHMSSTEDIPVSLLMHTLHVDLGARSYPLYIGRDLFADSELLAQHIAGSQVVIVSNENVIVVHVAGLPRAISVVAVSNAVPHTTKGYARCDKSDGDDKGANEEMFAAHVISVPGGSAY